MMRTKRLEHEVQDGLALTHKVKKVGGKIMRNRKMNCGKTGDHTVTDSQSI